MPLHGLFPVLDRDSYFRMDARYFFVVVNKLVLFFPSLNNPDNPTGSFGLPGRVASVLIPRDAPAFFPAPAFTGDFFNFIDIAVLLFPSRGCITRYLRYRGSRQRGIFPRTPGTEYPV